jgi:hypothetical protein
MAWLHPSQAQDEVERAECVTPHGELVEPWEAAVFSKLSKSILALKVAIETAIPHQ